MVGPGYSPLTGRPCAVRWAPTAAFELGTEGDGLVAVFPRARDAVAAAARAQRALAAHRWPAGTRVLVRMDCIRASRR
jgi:class 3 adenylate cyclase